ncbi:MAG: NUDIX domain-containing protein [Anaerolineae bacterium]
MGANEQGANATEGRWLLIPRTLSFVRNGDDVLLMKRGPRRRVFPNRYNGLGGHIERDEDVWNSARREIEEESGLAIRDLRLHGIHQIDTGESTGIVLFIFSAWSDSRDTVDSTEGTLEWVHPRDLPDMDLVEDVAEILKRVLTASEGAPPWYAHVSYDAHDQIVIRFADPSTAEDD